MLSLDFIEPDFDRRNQFGRERFAPIAVAQNIRVLKERGSPLLMVETSDSGREAAIRLSDRSCYTA